MKVAIQYGDLLSTRGFGWYPSPILKPAHGSILTVGVLLIEIPDNVLVSLVLDGTVVTFMENYYRVNFNQPAHNMNADNIYLTLDKIVEMILMDEKKNGQSIS